MTHRPMYLGHVNIYVRDAERSHTWYEEVLGLHTYHKRPGWAAFMAADLDQSHEVALMQLGDGAPGPQRGQVGLNHMAWRVESLDDLKDFYYRIKDKNVPIDRVADHGVSLGIYFHDPDGNGIEVYYELPRQEWPRQEEWLALIADDARYWMPMRRNVKVGEAEREFTRAGQDINWFDEGKETLTRRVKQILTGMHWAEEPVSRISHMVSNVRLLEINPSAAEPAEVTVRCRFLIYRNRVETETDILVGKREDLLRKVDGQWQIARRKI